MTIQVINNSTTVSVIVSGVTISGMFARATANGSADYTITSATLVTLAALSANRAVNLPPPTDGRPLTILNQNVSGFHWSFGTVTVNDFSGNPVTVLNNTSIYQLAGNGTSYDIIN